MKRQSKQLLKHCHNQLYMFNHTLLLYNHIVGSYDKLQHVISMNLDLVQFYLNMC